MRCRTWCCSTTASTTTSPMATWQQVGRRWRRQQQQHRCARRGCQRCMISGAVAPPVQQTLPVHDFTAGHSTVICCLAVSSGSCCTLFSHQQLSAGVLVLCLCLFCRPRAWQLPFNHVCCSRTAPDAAAAVIAWRPCPYSAAAAAATLRCTRPSWPCLTATAP